MRINLLLFVLFTVIGAPAAVPPKAVVPKATQKHKYKATQGQGEKVFKAEPANALSKAERAKKKAAALEKKSAAKKAKKAKKANKG